MQNNEAIGARETGRLDYILLFQFKHDEYEATSFSGYDALLLTRLLCTSWSLSMLILYSFVMQSIGLTMIIVRKKMSYFLPL